MSVIFKYPLALLDSQIIYLPPVAKVLSVQVQHEAMCLWALVPSNTPASDMWEIQIIGTGNPVPRELRPFLGTVQLAGGSLVFHVFGDRQAARAKP